MHEERDKGFEEEFKVTQMQHKYSVLIFSKDNYYLDKDVHSKHKYHVCEMKHEATSCCIYETYLAIYAYSLFPIRVQGIVDDPKGIHDIAIANRTKNRYHNVHTCRFFVLTVNQFYNL